MDESFAQKFRRARDREVIPVPRREKTKRDENVMRAGVAGYDLSACAPRAFSIEIAATRAAYGNIPGNGDTSNIRS